MSQTPDAMGALHLAVCRRFGEAVRSAEGKWERPSPCDEWDARGVLEHVIGFHDVLLLRPAGLKPDRPRENAQLRWNVTYERIEQAFDPARKLFERMVEVPVPSLTRDVLVHTWDLARAVGADDQLDPRWCEVFYAPLQVDPEALTGTGMFKPAVAVSDGANAQSRLLARLGRNPAWR
ncbi:maleylpyruvate isomerase family mycothiol-dependent enzyme [Mycolicibacterium sp. Dal123E01]|uniref:maleylpyruvate isomerase family mycothiol-dependent enzyme n=1 Tax=Mycolicibacterium sp. Dal123E01 TaxID=3457578 RepID=UPI00403E3884